jgi:hypothetical protein
MPMDNVTLENTQQSISSRDTKSVASVMVNGKWVNLSDTLEQTNVKSDVGAVSKQVAEQQTVITSMVAQADSAVESAGENAKALASQANALSDAKKAIDSDVASAKGLANTAQATADNAIKSASSVANDLAAVASQAKSNASGITKVTSDVGLLQTTVADNSGNISKIQETATKIQQAVSDNSGAIMTATQTAQSAVTVASDAKSNATVAVQTASGASVTAKNAQGDATTAITTAKGAVTQASDAKSNATIAVQTASEASVTATNAQSDASFAKQTASDASVQIKNAQGDISKLQTRAGTIEASVATNSGAIADVQATANQLKASVSDNAGNITVAKQTADSAVAVASDARSNATVAIQTASQASITASSASGQAASAVLTANGAMTTASDAKSDATVAVQTASGASLTATNAQGDAAIAKQTASEAIVQASNAESDFAQLSIRANKIEANVANNSGAIASVQQTANGLTSRVGNLESKTDTQQTAIEQNKNAITLKADQTNVDKINGTVNQLQSSLSVQAGQIQTKVSASDVSGMLTGYATQSYAQSLVTQKADEWNVNLTKLKNDTQTSLTNLAVGVEGVQAQVYNSDGSSKITQLSNLIATKVSQGDYNSQITQLQNDINLRVAKGDVISQINQEAGGDTLIQVSNGKKSLILDAANTIITGEAWIPGAAIGSLDASKLTFYGANNTYATIGASVAQYDDDNQKSTINLQYNGGIEIHSSNQQGSILTMHDNTIRLASKSWGDNPNAYQYSGFYAAPNYSLMNTYHKDGTTSGVAIDDDRIHIYGSSKDNQLGALQADVGWYSINGKTGLLTGNQISLKAGNTQAVLNDNNININNASDTNSKNYDVAIHIKGWAEMTGWFTCMGITQTSLLSTKTRIEPLDTKVALDKIVSANVETYQFKSDVAKGKTKRHTSVIIDDVNDVAEYYTPEEFISENRMGRDDGDIIGYLMGAVQELKKQLDELKEKI